MRKYLSCASLALALAGSVSGCAKATGFGGSGGAGGSGGDTSSTGSRLSSVGSTVGATSSGPGASTSEAASSSAGVGGATSSSVAASSVAATSSSVVASSAAASTSASTSGGGNCVLGHLVINQVRTRGAAGAGDEFVELFNATNADVVLDASWTVEARSSTAASYGSRWKGNGATIPAQKHFLLAGSTYSGAIAADGMLSTGTTDASSVRLVQSGTTIDAVCLAFDATTQSAYSAGGYDCEGTPVSNLPHDNSIQGMSNSDSSVARSGCVDSGDNATDFVTSSPATPENSTM